ncbi:MAG: hypothetical protein OXT09_34410 [Myxococcales bacterium]|nr:hypothetical protein [Myxococcales bacterium]
MTPPCKLYVTYRSEYLVLRDLCVGVRDRATGAWIPLHAASCAHLLGPTLDPVDHPCGAKPPRVGEHLSLYAAARRVVTGPIVAIERASPAMIEEADRRWQALFSRSDARHSMLVLSG